MLKSMTGFGKSECNINGKKIIIEIKTLNSKQPDISTKLSQCYRNKELDIRQIAQKILERGRIDILINYEKQSTDENYSLNTGLIRLYYNEMKKFNDETLKVSNPDWLAFISRLPDVFLQNHAEVSEEEWIVLSKAIEEAARQADEFRIKEGSVLEPELINRIERIKTLLTGVQKYENPRTENIKARIAQGIETLAGSEGYDKNRLEQEMVYYIEKYDFTEEKVRLANHCEYFRTTCMEQSNGRKLGFITQEIGREINTLGSKANNFEIQQIVVEMKDELEKIKEQLLNIL